MKNAYTLLGLMFLLVFVGAYLLIKRAEAPDVINTVETPITSSHEEVDPINQTNEQTTMTMKLTSTAFTEGGVIPTQYTCDGDNVPPPLNVSGVPEEAGSLVLVMDDPDIPAEVKASMGIEKFNHWAMYNIPADTTEIGKESGNLALNGRDVLAYTGPCPPPQYQPTTHRYIFRLYALPGQLNFIKAPTLDEVEAAAKGNAIATAQLVGIYDRSGQQ